MADITTTTPARAGGTRIHVSLSVRRRRLVKVLECLDAFVEAERGLALADALHDCDPERHAASLTHAEVTSDQLSVARRDLEAVVPDGPAPDAFTHLCKVMEFALDAPDAESLSAMRAVLEWHVDSMQSGAFADPAAKDAAYLAREVMARIAAYADIDKRPSIFELTA